MKAKINKGVLNGSGFRFAIIVSSWNDAITSKLLDGALEALEKTGVQESNVEIFRVPGSYEIPLIALKAAKTGKFDALICLGTIIRGETPHFEYVASEVAKGISQVAIQVELPVIFGIVTADNIEQAMNRAGIKLGNKGYEAAMTAVEMANLCKLIQENSKE